MKILVAPNAFKGSLSARDFCIRASFLSKKHQVKFMPFSDGGDSIIEVFACCVSGCRLYYTNAYNAVHKKHKVPYLILPDAKTCIIESAKVCGLGELKNSERDFMGASSYGIGQVIKAAYKKGARVFYVGLGGVAFNDGGTGAAMALGYKFYDSKKRLIKKGLTHLAELSYIKKPAFLPDVKVYGLSDVENPLLGPLGSAAVYGPQKGATPGQVILAEKILNNLHKKVKRDLGININTKYCGSCGALGAGLKGFLGGKLVSGAPFIAKAINLNKYIKRADIIITGEGKLDQQRFYGKGPLYICKVASKYKKPVIFICGINEIKNKNLLKKYSVKQVISLADKAGTAYSAFKNAGFYLQKVLKEIPL